MSYFELQPSGAFDPVCLKVLKDSRTLLSTLDPKWVKAMSFTPNKENLILEAKSSALTLMYLAQKQAIYYQGKLLYADPYNKAKVFHKLSYDGKWHLEIIFEISQKEITSNTILFHSTGRWLIHKNFLHLLDDSVDKRSLELPLLEKTKDAVIKEWILKPLDYPYAEKLILDETIELFEEKTSSSMPTLYWNDYAWSEASLKTNHSSELKSAQNDLIELGACFKNLPGGGTCFSWSNPEKLYEAMELLLESGWQIKGPKEESLALLGPIQIEKVIQEGGEIHIQASAKAKNTTIKQTPITAGALSHYLKRAAKYLPLDQKTWLLLPPASKHPELIQGKSQGDRISIESWRLQTLKHLPLETMSENLKMWAQLASSQNSFSSTFELQSIELREYQKQGVQWLLELAKLGIGGLLADEMGLGKTIQTLSFLKELNKPMGTQDLIVAPRSLMQTWKGQIKKLLGIDAYIHHGDDRDVASEGSLQKAPIVLTTYQTLRQDFELFSREKEKRWRVAIFDECHLWRNPQTQGYLVLEKLQAHMKVGLSGTPIYNSLEDLWHQLRLLAPQIIGEKPDSIKESINELRPLWLRRSKEEVAPELPDKIQEIIWLEMNPEQADLYQKLLETTLKEEEGKNPTSFQILEKILRLRQCCLLPSLIDPQTQDTGIKAEQLLLDLETLLSESRSVIIFSQFSTVLNKMYSLAKSKWKTYYIDSHTKDRESIMDEFQNGAPSALFMTLGTGSVGLNLTRASAVILLDPWWNESVENQAIDRAHRIGQTQNVLIRRYMIQNTLEQAMDELKNSKKEAIKAWLSSSEASSNFELDLWDKLRT